MSKSDGLLNVVKDLGVVPDGIYLLFGGGGVESSRPLHLSLPHIRGFLHIASSLKSHVLKGFGMRSVSFTQLCGVEHGS